jgi:hypothetical protein
MQKMKYRRMSCVQNTHLNFSFYICNYIFATNIFNDTWDMNMKMEKETIYIVTFLV